MPLWLSIFETAVRFFLPYQKLSTRMLSQGPHMPTDQYPNRQGREKHRGLSAIERAEWCLVTHEWYPLQELNSDFLRWESHRNNFKICYTQPCRLPLPFQANPLQSLPGVCFILLNKCWLSLCPLAEFFASRGKKKHSPSNRQSSQASWVCIFIIARKSLNYYCFKHLWIC